MGSAFENIELYKKPKGVTTLYQRMGGEVPLEKVVDGVYHLMKASYNSITGFTPKGRVPYDTCICPFTCPIKYNPILKHPTWCVALAENIKIRKRTRKT